MPRVAVDLSGAKYGLLTVIGRDFSFRGGFGQSAMWIVRCDCGNERVIRSDVIRSHGQLSCGCMRGKNNPRATGLPKQMFQRWKNMMRRCYSPSTEKDKKNYMDRGITVASAWHDPKQFYADMGDAPFEGATLDRRNNALGYSKENCRWATYSEQNKNRRPFSRVKEVSH